MLFLMACMAYFNPSAPVRERVDNYCQFQITTLAQKLSILKASSESKASPKILRTQFLQARLVYKKLSVLTEYYNVYESKFLNGAAISRAEDGTPDVIIRPQGFQAMEEVVYHEIGQESYAEISRLTDKMLAVLKRLENETDRSNKFTKETVWDAIRSSIIRAVALGITGYDSPVAFNSLKETKASLEGTKDIIIMFNNDIEQAAPGATQTLVELIENAIRYLDIHDDFNRFDRLTFISDFVNPLFSKLTAVREKAGIATPPSHSPVNYHATSFFQQNFFNINFFSPGKEYWMNSKRVELGKKLFFNFFLSGTNDRSCATCHSPGRGFSDGLRVPLSTDNKTSLTRNSPTLWNSALQTRQFFDTRAEVLEGQLKEVVHNSEEMKGSLAQSVALLKNKQEYVGYFKDAYPEEKEPLNGYNIANAISSYVRSLTSFDSRFDQYMAGDRSKLNASEKRGFNLFSGKAKCATCHFIPLFNGLVPPDFTETETEVLGVPETANKKNPRLDPDLGKYNISMSEIHKYSFKTPTLRNIELTGPYMHNGVFNTLEEVMDFYNEGGGEGLNIAPENQTLPREKLKLTKREMSDIVSFMKALTGEAARNY